MANGLVFLGSSGGRLDAFDAAGTAGCHGTPKVCDALWPGPATGGAIFSSPIVANGIVYVGQDSGGITAWALPNHARALRKHVVKSAHSKIPATRSRGDLWRLQ